MLMTRIVARAEWFLYVYVCHHHQIQGTNMPPLQAALPQELPTSLAGDVMRADIGHGQQQPQQHPADAFLEAMGAPIPIAPGSEEVPVTDHGREDHSHKDNADITKRTTRSSRFRGVTKHRRSGRWEAHIWVKASGKQVYLGGYEVEEHAAEAYDVAAIKCKGPKVKTNFPLEKYTELMRFMDTISLEVRTPFTRTTTTTTTTTTRGRRRRREREREKLIASLA